MELRATAQARRVAAADPCLTAAPETAVSSPSTVVPTGLQSSFLGPTLNTSGLNSPSRVQPEKAVSPPISVPQVASWDMINALADLERRRAAIGIKVSQPAETAVGLSWLSELQTAVSAPSNDRAETAVPAYLVTGRETAVSRPLPLDGTQTVRVWPSLAAGLAKEGYAPHYRLYVACQSVDPDGRRAFESSDLRAAFTVEDDARYLFSWRRMRQILGQGNGYLWDIDQATGRVYLYSVARLAALGDLQNIGRAVALPSRFLFDGQGVFNAQMHAAWLAAHGGEEKPISRAAIEAATAVPERTQRHYARVAGVIRQQNLEIGPRHTEETEEEMAWRHGRSSFEFIDYHGRQGQPNARYRARQLPNSYPRRHQVGAGGRRRKINKQLNSLVNHEERGSQFRRVDKRYFANGRAAAREGGRPPETQAYWPENGRNAGCYRVWYGVD